MQPSHNLLKNARDESSIEDINRLMGANKAGQADSQQEGSGAAVTKHNKRASLDDSNVPSLTKKAPAAKADQEMIKFSPR